MGPTVSRYFVPAVALLVTFIAGGALFFAIVAVNPSEDGTADTSATPATTPDATGTAVVTSTLVPGTSTALSTPAPTASAVAASPSPSTPLANFAGTWRLVDTVEEGRGAGETYVFLVTIVQSGSALEGGAADAINFSGTVVVNVATVEFSQPALGVTGIFIWTMQPDGNATGTFTSSVPNSGTSQLLRVP
jgi:hypothetical protein